MSNLIQKPSPNFDDRANGVTPTMIILHYTGMQTADEALDRLCNADAKVSAHYTIDEAGVVYQHVEEEKRAWHAGVSSWRDVKDINSRSVGIEIVNPGHEYGYRQFPEVQIQQVIALCQDLQSRHDIEQVLAHSDIAPDRKQDPGELFPWKILAEQGVGLWPSVSDEDCVKAAGIDVITALRDFGYSAVKSQAMILAFQRHYVPEVFKSGDEGRICGITKSRLYALLARYLISSH